MGKAIRHLGVWDWDMLLGVAALFATLAAMEPSGTAQTMAYAATMVLTVILGLRVYRREPRVLIEEGWHDKWNPVRDEASDFSAIIAKAYEQFWATHKHLPRTWPDLAHRVAWPPANHKPLRDLDSAIRSHASDDVRLFYAFSDLVARGESGIGHELPRVDNFRRHFVNALRFFGEAIDQEVPGMLGFLEEKIQLRKGFLDIMTLCAYMEIARATQMQSDARGDVATGFWLLGKEWHPVMLSVSSTATPPSP